MDACIKKMWYTYIIIYYLACKRKEILSFDNMGESRGYYAKWNRSGTERHIEELKEAEWSGSYQGQTNMGIGENIGQITKISVMSNKFGESTLRYGDYS
jgi:hypothetical protein